MEFEKIADKLYGETSEEEMLDMYKKVIEKHGVYSREEFLGKEVNWFIKAKFFLVVRSNEIGDEVKNKHF